MECLHKNSNFASYFSPLSKFYIKYKEIYLDETLTPSIMDFYDFVKERRVRIFLNLVLDYLVWGRFRLLEREAIRGRHRGREGKLIFVFVKV
jgi:hypothetical protein